MSDPTRYDDNGDGSGKLARAFRTMPRWKVAALVVSLVVGVLAAGSYLTANRLRQKQQVTTTQTVTTPGTPAGASGFAGGTDQSQTQTVTVTKTPDPSLTEQYTPLVARVGFSFFVGMIAGVISRTFLKLAALLAALIVGAVAAAHYFNINLDLTGVKAQTAQAQTWIQGQAGQLWEAVKGHLPSAGSATAGFLFGMKRK